MNITKSNKIYKSKTHLTFSCQYHVIFCPKWRRRVLKNEIEDRLKELCYQIAEQYDFEILEMEVMPDHVHILIDCNPRFGIMNVVNKIKGITSRTLRNEFPELKSKLPTMWTRSAFISTVGTVSLEVVKKYIEDQKNV